MKTTGQKSLGNLPSSLLRRPPLLASAAFAVIAFCVLSFLNLLSFRYALLGSIGTLTITALLFVRVPTAFSLRTPNWLLFLGIPASAFLFGLTYFLMKLPGAKVVLPGIMVFVLIGILVVYRDNLITLAPTPQTLYRFLLPVTLLFAALFSFLLFRVVGYGHIGLLIALGFIGIYPLFLIWHFGKHYSILFLTFLPLGMWPFLTGNEGVAKVFSKIQLVFIVALLAMVVIRFWRRGLPIRFPAGSIYFASVLYLFWLTLSTICSQIADRQATLKVIFGIVMVIFIFATLQNLVTKKDLYAILGGYIAGTLIVVGVILFDAFTQLKSANLARFIASGFRASLPNVNPAFSAVPLFSLFILSFAYVYRGTGKWRILALIVMGVSFVAIGLTGTRLYILSAAFAVVIMSFGSKTWRNWALFAMIAMVAIVVAVYLYNPQIFAIVTRSREGDSGHSDLWRTAWNVIEHNMWLGAGANASVNRIPLELAGGRASNIFFTEAMDSGLVGFGLLVLVYLCIWRWILKQPLANASMWRVAAIGFLFGFLPSGIGGSTNFLFSHVNIGECHHPLIAMLLATGDALPDE